MLHRARHITDQELLPFLDGELPIRRARKIQAHLEGCWSCRARSVDIEQAIHAFMHSRDLELDRALPSADGPRSLLRARLSVLAKAPIAAPRGFIPRFVTPLRMATVAIASVSLVVGGKLLLKHPKARTESPSVAAIERGTLPEPRFTPGATRIVAIDDVCAMAQEEVVAAVSEPIRRQVLNEYGIANAKAGDFEIDYLIAPGLGGIEDLRNLWPEPYAAQTWNAHVKDELERRLHQMVCSGNLDLPTAQREIAGNWIAAYKKYFHTDTPMAEQSRVQAAMQRNKART